MIVLLLINNNKKHNPSHKLKQIRDRQSILSTRSDSPIQTLSTTALERESITIFHRFPPSE